MGEGPITLKSQAEIELMADAGKYLAEVLLQLTEQTKIGVTTSDLDRLSEEYIRQKNCSPAFKGYRGYKYTLCASVNSAIVHGTPNRVPLKDGDLITLDLGLIYKNWYSDAAITIGLGQLSEQDKRLINVCESALYLGIKEAYPGKRIGDIGQVIEETVNNAGFANVLNYGGHGIGKALHEPPAITHKGPRGLGIRLKEGMVLCLEPMVVIESADNYLDSKDNWTVYSKNGKNSAHFEHTIAITKDGPRILTKL